MSTATSTPILERAIRDDLRIVGLTVKQYDWLIAQGKIHEDLTTELIEGMIVRKDRSAVGEDRMSVGDRQRTTLNVLARIDPKLHRFGCFVQTRQPIWLPPQSEPEPDASIVIGQVEEYRTRKPTAVEITSVIEVADSSLQTDLGTKLNMYARGKIAEYIVVNLVDNIVLVHQNPSRGKYPAPKVLRSGDKLKISAGNGRSVEIAVATLF